MLSVGLLFKVGAAPFHSWTPDVYQGAPTPVTAFMAAGTKIAAFGALLRLFYVAFGSERWSWQPMLWVIAILTMVVGAVLAVVQTDMKRMLAYSSVAHTGFLLTGVLGVQQASELSDGQVTSMQAVLFYLTTYGFAMVGAFAVVTLVRDSGGEATPFARWQGLGRRSPLVAGLFAFFLLSMAGIPLTAGFVGKWAVFTVALSAGAWPVVVAAIVCSIIAVFFYVRVIVLMFFVDGEPGGEVASVDAAVAADLRDHRRGRRRDPRPGHPARPGSHSRGPCGRIRQVTVPGLALPVTDEALAGRLRDRMARGRGGAGRARPQPGRVRQRDRQPPDGGRREAVPAAAGAARGRDR